MNASSRDVPFPSVETVSPRDVISNDGDNIGDSPSRPSTPSVGTMTPAASTPEAGRVMLSSTGEESHGAAHGLQDRPAQTNGLENGFDNLHLSPGPDTSRDSLSPRRNRRQRSNSHLIVTIHDVRNEERPENAFHRPEFQEALTDAKSLMARVASTLAGSAIHSDVQSTLHRLHKEASRLAEYRCAPVRRVGFVGDSGAGKSSLLNSLLDTRGLARTSSSGEACTCVVTEYHHHPQNSLDIDVELLSEDELQEQIKSLLQSYRRYHLDEDAMDEAERQDFRPKAELARSTFDAMFRGYLQNEDMLLAGHEDEVLETLMSWAIDSRIFRVRQRHIGLSIEDCSARLRHLSSDSGSRDEPAHWPFIKMIKVFLNAHVLSTGLILVDLPGLRDLNSARRLITERYMLSCQEIFVVCNISRAVTDEGVHDVFNLANNAGLSNIGIVCTRSEDIQAEEAIRDPGWRGERTIHIRQIMAAIKTASTELARNQEELKFYLELDDDDRFPEEIDEERRLSRQNLRLKNEQTDLEHQLKRYLMTNRNTFVTQALRDLYTDRVGPSDDLKVFCVSNKDYWAAREFPAETARPCLELSGILAARRHCLSLVAQSQLRAARSYLRDEIPIVLSQIDLWVEAGARDSSEERRGEIRRVLDEVERVLRGQLLAPTTDVNRVATNLKRLFMNLIYSRRHIASWSQCAGQAAAEWSNWYHASYAAFCRNDGDYTTEKIGKRDWNAEAIASMVEDLGDPWAELTVSLQQVQQDVLVVIEEVIENSVRLLRDTPEVSPGVHALDHLVRALDPQGRMLFTSLENHFNLLESNLSLLRISVMSSIRSSMIRQVMAAAYSTAKQEYGGGSDRRRKRIISDAFSEQEVFQTIMRDFKSLFLVHTEDLQDNIRASVSAYIDAISEDLDLVRMESVAEESDQDPAFRDLVTSRLRESWDQLRLIQVVAEEST